MTSQFLITAEKSLKDDILELKSWCDQERGRRAAFAKSFRISDSTIGSWFAHRILPTTVQSLLIREFLAHSKSWPAVEPSLITHNAQLQRGGILSQMTTWCNGARGRRIDIASALNTDPASISDWIKGKSCPKAIRFRALEFFLVEDGREISRPTQ
jgi:hypothetical protein